MDIFSTVLVVIVASLPVVYYVQQTWGLLLLKMDVGTNDNQFATRTFIELLQDARETMMVCDDGNKMEDSIYESDEVVNAIETALKSNPQLRLLCLFSSEDETLFTQKFEKTNKLRSSGQDRDETSTSRSSTKASRLRFDPSVQLGRATVQAVRLSRVPVNIREAALGRHVRDMRAHFPTTEAAVA